MSEKCQERTFPSKKEIADLAVRSKVKVRRLYFNSFANAAVSWSWVYGFGSKVLPQSDQWNFIVQPDAQDVVGEKRVRGCCAGHPNSVGRIRTSSAENHDQDIRLTKNG